MEKLSIRTPNFADLASALKAAGNVHVALPAILSAALVALLTNVLTALVAVGATVYLQQVFAQIRVKD